MYELEVDLWSTSLIFNKGYQIRIAVSSSNSPCFEPNPNAGTPHPIPGKKRIATNTLHLASNRPSRIILPIYKDPVVIRLEK